MGKAVRIAEADHHLRTGRVSLLYPTVAGQPQKLPKCKETDLRPGRASRSEVFGKRASVLGRPVGRVEVEVEEGLVEERVAYDASAKDGFGTRCLWLIDGTLYEGTDGDRHHKMPSLSEALDRFEAGALVGDVPQSIIRIPVEG